LKIRTGCSGPALGLRLENNEGVRETGPPLKKMPQVSLRRGVGSPRGSFQSPRLAHLHYSTAYMCL
jgi:hypothetical protein